MNIKYRNAVVDDAYGFEFVAAHSWRDTYWEMLPQDILENRIKRLDNEEELSVKLETIKKSLSENAGNVFVAVHEDKIIGIVEVGEGLDNYKDYGRIEALYLLNKYHKRGIGKELFFLGIKRLIEMGYKKIELECMENNPTLGFYQKYDGYIDKIIEEEIYGRKVNVNIVLFDNIKNMYKTLEDGINAKD